MPERLDGLPSRFTAIFYLTHLRDLSYPAEDQGFVLIQLQEVAFMRFDPKANCLVGDHGSLPISTSDEVTRKLLMLMEGECQGIGPLKAAQKFGYTKQRYFQLREIYLRDGSRGLLSKLRGPKGNSRRTDEVVRQIIRHRFLDPQASAEVIAQKLRQTGFTISTRSVERAIADYGLQKKTLSMPPSGGARTRH